MREGQAVLGGPLQPHRQPVAGGGEVLTLHSDSSGGWEAYQVTKAAPYVVDPVATGSAARQKG